MAPMKTKTTDSAEVKTDFFDRALAPLTRRGASDAASLKARMIYRRKITPSNMPTPAAMATDVKGLSLIDVLALAVRSS